jgi:F0F1-type ATP synthase delta subunit
VSWSVLREDMKKNNTKQINEALDLLNSEVKDVFVDDLQLSIERAIDKAKGKANALIESAVVLSGPEKAKVEKLITEILKRTVEVTYGVKPTLLGGIKISVGDWKLDATLLHQIETMKNIFGGTL